MSQESYHAILLSTVSDVENKATSTTFPSLYWIFQRFDDVLEAPKPRQLLFGQLQLLLLEPLVKRPEMLVPGAVHHAEQHLIGQHRYFFLLVVLVFFRFFHNLFVVRLPILVITGRVVLRWILGLGGFAMALGGGVHVCLEFVINPLPRSFRKPRCKNTPRTLCHITPQKPLKRRSGGHCFK